MKLYCNLSTFALVSTIVVALLLSNHEVSAASAAENVILFPEDHDESPLVFLRGSDLQADALPSTFNSNDDSADEEVGSVVLLPHGNKLPEAAKLDVG
jgi:hypothetical protein